MGSRARGLYSADEALIPPGAFIVAVYDVVLFLGYGLFTVPLICRLVICRADAECTFAVGCVNSAACWILLRVGPVSLGLVSICYWCVAEDGLVAGLYCTVRDDDYMSYYCD